MSKFSLIDTHAHLGAPDFAADLEQVVERAKEAGVKQIITVGAGYGKASAEEAVRIADRFPEVFLALGLHPCDSTEVLDLPWLEALCAHPKLRAIGETGLDFYWDKAPREIQYTNFRLQIELAIRKNLPIVVHSRNAGPECLKTLQETGAKAVGGVFHCFSEDAAFARELADINFKVSFPGVLTFKKADALRAVAKEIPLSQIMLETDCPFLAPQKMRGKRCEPAYVVDVCETLAQVKALSFEEVSFATTATAQSFFRLDSVLT